MESVIMEMNELIRKNLPEATATTLKKYLEEAEENKKRLKENELSFAVVSKRAEEQTARLADSLREIEKFKGVVKRDEDLMTREKAVTEKEVTQEVKFSLLKASEAEKRADSLYRLAEIVFRNPVLVRSVTKNGNGSRFQCGAGQDSTTSTDTEILREGLE